jgi:hypothetical protein
MGGFSKLDHMTSARSLAEIPPRYARPPFVKGVFGPPLFQRGDRGDLRIVREEVYACLWSD